jgi:hypothetical protein
MDIISLLIGFSIGVVIVGLAFEMGMKRTSRTPPTLKQTKKWNISEITNPRIMAEYLSDIDIPKNSKIIVNKYKTKEALIGLNVKEHSGIKGNFIVGDDRALILAGPMRKDEMGIWTVEKEIVEELNQEFNKMWSEATNLHKGKEN